MKTLFLFIITNFFISGLLAQVPSDTIFSIVNGHQVSIHQNNAYHNCGFSPGLKHVVINDSVVNWYQVDTLYIFYGCMCFFDYSVSIDTLKAGTYIANVYSVYNTPDIHDTSYQGSTSFTIFEQNQCDEAIKLLSTKSDCHQYNALKKQFAFEDLFKIHIGQDWFSINSVGLLSIANISLFNLSGQLVLSEKFDFATETRMSTSSLTKGIYILSITDQQKNIYYKKIPVR